jgi:RNA polymerase sigma-70 factor (ECF subfamily)
MEELITQVSPDLYRVIFSIVHDHDDTDEILQESLIRLFRHIGALKEVDRFAAWVMRIAVNQVQTYRLRKSRNRLYEISESREISNSAVVLAGGPPEDPSDRLMREQLRAEIVQAMEMLPERQRMATVLFELEGLSIREVAKVMDCSEGAIKFNIHEGRKKLKQRLFHLVEGLRWGRKHSTAGAGSLHSSQFGLRRLSRSQSALSNPSLKAVGEE